MTNELGSYSTSAQDFLDRWDAQQSVYVTGREELFTLMFDVLERVSGAPGTFLDLASGPGVLASRVKKRWPECKVYALELDPMLIQLGKDAHGDAITWIDRDLRDAAWSSDFLEGSLDAVCSSTALHYLRPMHLPGITNGVARLLKTGGVFANLDTMGSPAAFNQLGKILTTMREERWQHGFADGRETWQQWWDALRAEPGYEQLYALRESRFEPRVEGTEPTLEEYYTALGEAGFAEWDVFASHIDKRLLVSVR